MPTGFRSLTASERALHIEHATDAVRAVATAEVARQHEPRNFLCRRRWEVIVLALVTIPSEETLLAYWASTDGDDAKAVAIPKSVLTVVQSEAGGLFILATMKAWVAIDRHMAQANIPTLVKSRALTDEQRIGWKRLQARITTVRRDVTEANKPRRFRKSVYSRTFAVRSRNDVA
jgi:hypothetical protein